MKIVTSFDVVYSVTDSSYKKLMTAIAKDESVDLTKYGVCLGVETKITDMTSAEAKEILKNLNHQ